MSSTTGDRMEPHGFIICIKNSRPGAKLQYVSWLEYGVIEVSPLHAEAWVFTTKQEAQASFDRNAGRIASGVGLVQVVPANDNRRADGGNGPRNA